jgi:hypothetical protein
MENAGNALPGCAGKEEMDGGKQDNLLRLTESEMPMDFVKKHNGEWDHFSWLDFCHSLDEEGYSPINLDQVGLLLEEKRTEYFQKKIQ